MTSQKSRTLMSILISVAIVVIGFPATTYLMQQLIWKLYVDVYYHGEAGTLMPQFEAAVASVMLAPFGYLYQWFGLQLHSLVDGDDTRLLMVLSVLTAAFWSGVLWLTGVVFLFSRHRTAIEN